MASTPTAHQQPVAREPWPAPYARGPINATVTVPGSKSLTNRYLVLAALADGPCTVGAVPPSRDSALMIEALRALGAQIIQQPSTVGYGWDLDITPIPAGHVLDQGTAVDCGLAGTVMRFVPAVAALCTGVSNFDGDPHARLRPMGPVLSALRELGVELRPVDESTEEVTALPFKLVGTGHVVGGHVTIDASSSSQFVSALLLAGARFDNGLHIEHVGKPVPSLDHIAMTITVLRSLGVQVDDSVPNHWEVAPGSIAAFDVMVEQDLSNAGPFLAAAVVTGGTVRIPRWPQQTTQVGGKWREILPAFGAEVTLDGGVLTVRGTGTISGVELADTSELAPTVAALAALAGTPSRLSGIAHLRGHETDRLAALAAEINALGGRATETADGLIIEPAPLHGGLFHTYADHRMATAGAVIGLATTGVAVEDISATSKTMPNFAQLWTGMFAQTSQAERSE